MGAFSISADLRVGGGTDRPADGFSFNFARFDDPAILDIVRGGTGIWAAAPDGEANLPEEGTTTGFAIGFDEWQSGPEAPGGDPNNLDFDAVGLSLRIDGQLVAQASLPVLNDGDDELSLQTGPAGVPPDQLDQLGWAQLTMHLDCTNDFIVTWKGEVAFVIPGADVPWEPTAGTLLFGGRTGGANAYHHIDNIGIQTYHCDFPLDCDFTANGGCDIDDINLLMNEVGAGTNDPAFDLNGDGLVNDGDRDEWLAQASIENGFVEPLLVGDSNLDGTVSANDLNALALNWRQNVHDWTAGNFTGAAVNAADLNELALNWQMSIPSAASQASAVPEPAATTLAVFALATVTCLRRRTLGT